MNMTQSYYEAQALLKKERFEKQYALFFFVSYIICIGVSLLSQQNLIHWFWSILAFTLSCLLNFWFIKKKEPIGTPRKPTEQEVENVRKYGRLQFKKIPFRKRAKKRIKEFTFSIIVIVFEFLTDLGIIKDGAEIEENY